MGMVDYSVVLELIDYSVMRQFIITVCYGDGRLQCGTRVKRL